MSSPTPVLPVPRRANNSILDALQDSQTSQFLPHDFTFQLFGNPQRSGSYNSLFGGSDDQATPEPADSPLFNSLTTGTRTGSAPPGGSEIVGGGLGSTNAAAAIITATSEAAPPALSTDGLNFASHGSLVGLDTGGNSSSAGYWGSGAFAGNNSSESSPGGGPRERSLSDSFGDGTLGLDLDGLSMLHISSERPASTPAVSLPGVVGGAFLYPGGGVGSEGGPNGGGAGGLHRASQFRQQQLQHQTQFAPQVQYSRQHYDSHHLQSQQLDEQHHDGGLSLHGADLSYLQKSTSAPSLHSMYSPNNGFSHHIHPGPSASLAAAAAERVGLQRNSSSGGLYQPHFPGQGAPRPVIRSGSSRSFHSQSPGPATPGSDGHSMYHSGRTASPSMAGKMNGDESAEDIVIRNCQLILEDAANHSLKAVELANTLRARIGTEILADIRERWGGLLALLERQQDMFIVRRIPKNDFVCLANSEEGHNLRNLDESARNSKSFSSVESFDDGLSEGQASRCLHVGNVPPNLTEAQLFTEFERFGELEALKVVTQRSRRFAFVTFATVEQAISAKQRMAKLSPWKSAISFAHKESIAGLADSVGPPHMQQQQQQQLQMQQQHQQQQQQQQQQLQQQMQRHPQLQRSGAPKVLRDEMLHANGVYGGHQGGYMQSHDHQQQYQEPSIAGMHGYVESGYHVGGAIGVGSGGGGGGVGVGGVGYGYVSEQQLPQQPQHYHDSHMGSSGMMMRNHMGGGGAPNPPTRAGFTCPVLQRLCDDTYVPTQPWPVDFVQDHPYYNACVAQLQQFGGGTSVSKLRGFLRNRLAASDNIKSVPLKAMLGAYPTLFLLRGNHVSLNGPGGIGM